MQLIINLILIYFFGTISCKLFNKIKLPSLIGMILCGILLGEYAFNLIDPSINTISSQIREVALIIIITRAGFKLNFHDLKAIGRPAILLSFLPAVFEIGAFALLGPLLFQTTILEGLIIGSVIAAVSPAIIVPRMIHLIDQKYGTKNKVPQMILAGASLDDIIVIILFTLFTTLQQSNHVSFIELFELPLSLFSGVVIGLLLAVILSKILTTCKLPTLLQTLLFFGITYILMPLDSYFYFSPLLAIMSMSIYMHTKHPSMIQPINRLYDKAWKIAEIYLFVLVGLLVNLPYALNAGLLAICIVLLAISIRLIGTYFAIWKTNLNKNEKCFIMISYIPKATVQAAIGATPLAMGLAIGELALTLSVISILIAAPIGAILMDTTYKKLLHKENSR